MSENAKGGIRKTYQPGRQYLDFPETKERRVDLNPFARQRDGSGSWETGAFVFPIVN